MGDYGHFTKYNTALWKANMINAVYSILTAHGFDEPCFIVVITSAQSVD